MENISKKVVDFESGKLVGYVLDVALDFSSFSQIGFYIVDEETEGEYLLTFENIRSSLDVILVDDISKLQFTTERSKSLLGREIIGENGLSYGCVEKLIFNKNKLVKLCSNKCEIFPKMIKTVGENFIILKGKRKQASKNSVFEPLEKEEVKVSIQTAKKETLTPEKLNLSFKYFVGKETAFDVFGYNNERIATKGEKISKNVFEKAKKHNKLNELFFAVKKY